MPKISANSLKIGNILIFNGDLWKTSKMPEHVKPGKGPAYVQVEMKNIKTGTKKNERFSSSDYLDKAFLDNINVQYLYTQGEHLVLMDNATYEQILIPKDVLEEKIVLLKDSMLLKAEMFEGEVMNLKLPTNIEVEISDTAPAIKGATVTSSYKKATLDCGLQVSIPPYIESGEKIIIKSDDLSFVERGKK